MQERRGIAVSRPVSAEQAPEVHREGSTVQDDWRAALDEVLEEVLDWNEGVVDALLPTVRQIVAAELRAAAEIQASDWPAARALINYRADALDATPDHGKA